MLIAKRYRDRRPRCCQQSPRTCCSVMRVSVRLDRRVSWTALRDWSFGEADTPAFGAFLERVHHRLPSLHEGFASIFYPALAQDRLTHPPLLLRAGHSPVIAAVPAGPLVDPVKSDQCHALKFCHERTIGAGHLWLAQRSASARPRPRRWRQPVAPDCGALVVGNLGRLQVFGYAGRAPWRVE